MDKTNISNSANTTNTSNISNSANTTNTSNISNSSNVEWSYASIEDKILSTAIKNKTFFLTLNDHLDKNCFLNKECQKIFMILKSFYKEHNFLPTKDFLLVQLNKLIEKRNNNADIELIEKVKELIVKIYDQDYVSPNETNFIMEEIDNFIKYNKIKKTILESVELLQKKQFDKIVEKIKDSVKFTSKIPSLASLTDDIESRYLKLTDPYNVAPTMLSTLNNYCEGGFHRGELNIIMAASGYGKSSFLLNLAVWYLKQDYKVLYLTFELSKEQIQLRMDRCLWNMTSSEIKNNWSILKEKYEILKRTCKGTIYVIEQSQYVFTKGDLERVLENLRNYQDFEPDIIIVDYLELMQSSFFWEKFNLKENERQKHIASDLRNLAREKNIILVTATQSNREIFKVDKDGEEQINEQQAIGESIDKIRISDVFCMILQTKEEREKDEARIRIIKNRHGSINVDINIIADYEKMRIEEKIIGI